MSGKACRYSRWQNCDNPDNTNSLVSRPVLLLRHLGEEPALVVEEHDPGRVVPVRTQLARVEHGRQQLDLLLAHVRPVPGHDEALRERLHLRALRDDPPDLGAGRAEPLGGHHHYGPPGQRGVFHGLVPGAHPPVDVLLVPARVDLRGVPVRLEGAQLGRLKHRLLLLFLLLLGSCRRREEEEDDDETE